MPVTAIKIIIRKRTATRFSSMKTKNWLMAEVENGLSGQTIELP